jgi:hypothetical protein
MRLPGMRFTLRRMGAVVAGCAFSLAILREAPWLVVVGPFVLIPVAGSLYEVRKGGEGLTGGLFGGMIASWSAALGFYVLACSQGVLLRLDLVDSLCAALIVTTLGGMLGGLVGIFVLYLNAIVGIWLRSDETIAVQTRLRG